LHKSNRPDREVCRCCNRTFVAQIGLAIPLVGLFLTRLMGALLYGVEPGDWRTFTAVSMCLMFVAVAACAIPARRATRVDPIIALRYE
jgi:ABC-type antimicrobial peptide transport system permease subunit